MALNEYTVPAGTLTAGVEGVAGGIPSSVATAARPTATFVLGGALGGRRWAWLSVGALWGMMPFWLAASQARMTVIENLRLGGFAHGGRADLAPELDRVWALFPVLRDRRGQLAGSLSGGEQQMLAIARAMMARPRLLMLDEPSLGLAPLLVREIFRIIPRLTAAGTAVLLVEQNARMALQCATDAYVLQTGRVVLSGRAADLLAAPEVQRAYLGAG